MYDFNEIIERRGINCVKWESDFITENMKPMWVADMDFRIAPAIEKRIQKVASQGTFGYQFLSDKYYESIINWMKTRHNLNVTREEIRYMPNVVQGLAYAVQAVSEPGDEIIIMTPVYGPFYRAVEENDRVIVRSEMKNENGYYTMDLEDFESKITSKTKATILCNPHNPSGRVWTREELQALTDICLKYDIFIISDDIHSELVRKECRHTFIASLSEEAAKKCITCTSPSKAFNLASIHVANCFIKDEEVRERFMKIAEKFSAAENNAFSEAALIGAYDESADWLDELNTYLDENVDYFVNYIQENIPEITVHRPEGTYLVWVDLRNLPMRGEEIDRFTREVCHVAVNNGTFFGNEGDGFVRFNLACPRAGIKPVLEKFKEEVQKIIRK